MSWKHEVPDVPGWYWFVGTVNGRLYMNGEIVHVVHVEFRERLDVVFSGDDYTTDLVECMGKWNGPLEFPQ